MNLTVAVDTEVCIGAGNCVEQAPAAFALNADGVAVLVDPTAVADDDLLAAEASCPVAAIVITEVAAP